MRHIRTAAKFLLLLGCFGLFALSVSIYSTGQMRAIGKSYDKLIATRSEAALLVVRASRMVQTARAALGDLVIAQTPERLNEARAELSSARKDFETFITQAEELAGSHAGEIRRLREGAQDLLDRACAASLATKGDDAQRRASYLSDCAARFPAFSLELRAAVDDLVAEANATRAALAEATVATTRTTFLLIVAGLAIALGLGYLAVRAWIVRPLLRLSSTMSTLAGGRLETEVCDSDRRDEIGAMARAVVCFREAGLEKRMLEAQAEMQRSRAEEERAQNEAARAAAMRAQQGAIEQIGAALAGLSRGDLSSNLESGFAPEYERLKIDFNAAVEVLRDTMRRISANSEDVRTGSDEIADASGDLARRTEQQAANLEETAAAVQQMTAAVRSNAENAGQALAASNDARLRADAAGDVVRHATSAMQRIEQCALRIGSIVRVIEDIAFQTNLLALNAGVEAARAGESGRGFAVVAQEVRELAQRCAEAAKEVAAIVTTSGQEVAVGVELVGRAESALTDIARRIEVVDAALSEIASATRQQSQGLEQINATVSQLDGSTQQNAAMVEESTAASRALADRAQSLAQLVAQFRLGGSEGRTATKARRIRAA